MAETALQAAYGALYIKLRSATIAGLKVYPDIADDEATYPYLVYFWAGGGESNRLRKHDANLVIGVKCVSNDLHQAFTGASEIVTLLNNQGIQDIVPATGAYVSNPLNGGSNWKIKTSTQEEAFHFTELIDNTSETVYHDGAYYRFNMEAS